MDCTQVAVTIGDLASVLDHRGEGPDEIPRYDGRLLSVLGE